MMVSECTTFERQDRHTDAVTTFPIRIPPIDELERFLIRLEEFEIAHAAAMENVANSLLIGTAHEEAVNLGETLKQRLRAFVEQLMDNSSSATTTGVANAKLKDTSTFLSPNETPPSSNEGKGFTRFFHFGLSSPSSSPHENQTEHSEISSISGSIMNSSPEPVLHAYEIVLLQYIKLLGPRRELPSVCACLRPQRSGIVYEKQLLSLRAELCFAVYSVQMDLLSMRAERYRRSSRKYSRFVEELNAVLSQLSLHQSILDRSAKTPSISNESHRMNQSQEGLTTQSSSSGGGTPQSVTSCSSVRFLVDLVEEFVMKFGVSAEKVDFKEESLRRISHLRQQLASHTSLVTQGPLNHSSATSSSGSNSDHELNNSPTESGLRRFFSPLLRSGIADAGSGDSPMDAVRADMMRSAGGQIYTDDLRIMERALNCEILTTLKEIMNAAAALAIARSRGTLKSLEQMERVRQKARADVQKQIKRLEEPFLLLGGSSPPGSYGSSSRPSSLRSIISSVLSPRSSGSGRDIGDGDDDREGYGENSGGVHGSLTTIALEELQLFKRRVDATYCRVEEELDDTIQPWLMIKQRALPTRKIHQYMSRKTSNTRGKAKDANGGLCSVFPCGKEKLDSAGAKSPGSEISCQDEHISLRSPIGVAMGSGDELESIDLHHSGGEGRCLIRALPSQSEEGEQRNTLVELPMWSPGSSRGDGELGCHGGGGFKISESSRSPILGTSGEVSMSASVCHSDSVSPREGGGDDEDLSRGGSRRGFSPSTNSPTQTYPQRRETEAWRVQLGPHSDSIQFHGIVSESTNPGTNMLESSIADSEQEQTSDEEGDPEGLQHKHSRRSRDEKFDSYNSLESSRSSTNALSRKEKRRFAKMNVLSKSSSNKSLEQEAIET